MSVVDFVEAGRKLRDLNDLSEEETVKLTAAESQLIKSVQAGEKLLSQDQLEFEDWKKLKRAQTVLGMREPDKPGVVESARRIAEQPGQAARNAPGLAAEAIKSAPGKAVRGVGAVANLAREAPGAAASFVRETAEDVGRIAEQPGEAARVALTTDTIPRAGEAALRGVTSGAFGLGDLAQQAGQAFGERISGQEPSTPQELAERAQFERERAAATNPEAFFGGQLVGATGTGGRLAIPAQRGSTASNVARGAGAGGVTAGAQAGFEGRDPGEAAAVGAVGGAAVPALLRGGQFAARPVTDRLRPTQAAERTLVFRAGEDADDLARAARLREEQTGRPQSVVQIADREAARRIGETAGRGGAAPARTIIDAANRAPVQRQGDLRRVVEAGGDTRAPTRGRLQQRAEQRRSAAIDETARRRETFQRQIAERRSAADQTRQSARETIDQTKAQFRDELAASRLASEDELRKRVSVFSDDIRGLPRKRGQITSSDVKADLDEFGDAFFKQNKNALVELGTEDTKFLLRKDIRKFLPDRVQNTLRKATAEGAESGEAFTTLPLRDLDNLRIDLRRAGSKTGAAARFRAAADQVTALAEESVPEYGDFLNAFAARARFLSGVDEGGSVFSKSGPDVSAFVRNSESEAVAGLRSGAQRKLLDISDSTKKSQKFANDILTDQRLYRNLEHVIGRENASHLRRSAEAVDRASRSIREGSDRLKRQQTTRFRELMRSVGRDIRQAQQAVAETPRPVRAVDRSQTTGARALRESVDAGRAIREPDSEFIEQVSNFHPIQRRVAQNVVRRSLAEQTGSPQSAARLARSLAEDESLQTKLTAAFGGDEAARLRAAGTAETQAAENLAEAGIAARGASRAAQNADAITEAIEGTIVLGGRASGAFISSFVRGLIDKLRIPPVAARKLAEMSVDRENVHRVIERLKAAQVRDQAIIDLFQESSAAAGVAADDRLRD